MCNTPALILLQTPALGPEHINEIKLFFSRFDYLFCRRLNSAELSIHTY